MDIVGYFIAEELPIQVWDVSQKFSEKKTYLDIVSQKQISCDFEYFLCCCKMKKTFGKRQLEAPRADKCKQILGLCQCVILPVM